MFNFALPESIATTDKHLSPHPNIFIPPVSDGSCVPVSVSDEEMAFGLSQVV